MNRLRRRFGKKTLDSVYGNENERLNKKKRSFKNRVSDSLRRRFGEKTLEDKGRNPFANMPVTMRGQGGGKRKRRKTQRKPRKTRRTKRRTRRSRR